jgi:hypothetical protein
VRPGLSLATVERMGIEPLTSSCARQHEPPHEHAEHSPVTKTLIVTILALLAGCSDGQGPTRDPRIDFDRKNYVVTLSTDATNLVSATPGAIIVTRGADPFPEYVKVFLEPVLGNTCLTVAGGTGFHEPSVLHSTQTPYDSIAVFPATFSDGIFAVCPALPSLLFPRGVTVLTAKYVAKGKTYTAHATLTVQ